MGYHGSNFIDCIRGKCPTSCTVSPLLGIVISQNLEATPVTQKKTTEETMVCSNSGILRSCGKYAE